MLKRIGFGMLMAICCIAFSQTTVIVHGYELTDPTGGWMLDMANALQQRTGGVVSVYDKNTGDLQYKSGSGSHNIIIFNWASGSTNADKGHSESAGAALFTMLMQGKINTQWQLNPIHLIGHSRGTAVVSEAAERLIKGGFIVDQVTYLDAHDWGQNLGISIAYTDYDANPDSLHSGVEGWKGIGYAESYWQDKTGFITEQKGRAVDGCYQEYLGKIGHQGIYEWYISTIIDNTQKTGYYYSTFGGGTAFRKPFTGLQRLPFFTFEKNGVANGDFERGGSTNSAGWAYHGGSGNGALSDAHLELKALNYYKRSDRFYIPVSVTAITYDFRIYAKDNGVPGNVDLLRIKLSGKTIDSLYLNYETTFYTQKIIPVSSVAGTIQNLEFEIEDQNGATSAINSEVWIDNIQMQFSTGITEYHGIPLFSLYPNPIHSSDVLYIDGITLNPNELIACYNMEGKLMWEKQLIQTSFEIYLQRGLYFIKHPASGSVQKLVVVD